MMTIKQLAADTGVTPSYIRRLARAFGFKRIGRDWLFDGEQVKAIKAYISRSKKPQLK